MEILSPFDCISAIKNSKQKDPTHKIVEVKINTVLDFEGCATDTITNKKKDDNGNTINWTQIQFPIQESIARYTKRDFY